MLCNTPLRSCRRRPLLQRQQGAALLLALFLAIALALTFFFRPTEMGIGDYAREQSSENVLTQAKDALIGKAVSERNNNFFGFLQVPDLGSTRNTMAREGASAGNFTGNAKNLSVLGRLPWRTLGVAPLKDSTGECLWYAVSGAAQSVQPPDVFNWDSIGHFDVFTSDGTPAGTVSTSAGNYHNRPLALVFSAGPPLAGQNRSTSSTDLVTECGGNYDVRNYLDSHTADANIQNIVNYFAASANNATGDASLLASPKTLISGTVDVVTASNKARITNDRLLTITSKEIFDRIKNRSDFKSDIDTLLNDLSACLNAIPPGALPTASITNKGIDNIIIACPAATPMKQAMLANWKDNLLYTGGPAGSFSVSNSAATCKAVLIFAGERTTRSVAPLTAQSRATAAQKGDASTYGDPAMYLEGTNATLFPANGTYTGSAYYATGSPSSDIVRCITGAGAAQVSFANDLPSFVRTGAIPTVITNTTENNLTITDNAAGTAAGCFWSPIPIPLARKTVRAYYEYQFDYADTFATSGAPDDRGNGMTFQLVRGDIPNTFGVATQPSTCGTEANLGAVGTTDIWGSLSYIVETDIRRNGGDPAGNHTAIMINGSLVHTASDTQTATSSAPCNGTKSSCLHYPANMFEESPTPLTHNQRIEIHTGCNLTCSRCNPSSGDGYAKISAWVDCTDCSDVSADLLNSELITNFSNRDFSAAGDWVGSNWSWLINAFNHTAGANAATLPNSSLGAPPTPGTNYRISLIVNTITPGNITIAFGGNSTTLLPQTSGTAAYNLQFSPVSAASLTLSPDAIWEGNISSASVRAVTPPQINRCVKLYDPEMNQAFFGINAGFLSTAETKQSVVLRNLYLRSD